MRKLFFTVLLLVIAILLGKPNQTTSNNDEVLAIQTQKLYWLKLHRKSNTEFLYLGEPGNIEESELVKTFKVKSGVPNKRPTPLPELLGREYWVLSSKREVNDNPETAPFFLSLDIPLSEEEPYGPVPYEECAGQCNWELPGEFGLHGVGGDNLKLAESNEGSSGCIRHSDNDITYLFNLLEPNVAEIRYYIQDI